MMLLRRSIPFLIYRQMTTMLLLLAIFSIESIVDGPSSLRSVLVAAAAKETILSEHDTTNEAPLPKLIPLRDGNTMPRVGLGVALTAEHTYEAVTHAITLGYRLIDTAAEESYGNEDQVGQAVNDYNNHNQLKDTGGDVEKIFVTTKLWDSDHGFYSTLRAFQKSYKELNKFATTSDNSRNDNDNDNGNQERSIPINLYLVHSPYGGRLVETWDALLWLQKHHSDKLVSIGVSNFGIDHLEILREAGRPMPVVNQIEMHPLVFSQRRELLAYCAEHKIQIQAFGSLLHGDSRFLSDPPPFLSKMVNRYNNTNGVEYAMYNAPDDGTAHIHESSTPVAAVTTAHVLLQWALQHGFAIIPKSSKTKRITENVGYVNLGREPQKKDTDENDAINSKSKTKAVDFRLSDEDMDVLDRWGDHVPYGYRNIYKTDWNWNPIDEAPLHSGSEEYWPDYEGLETDLESILEKVPDLDYEEEYWEEYWGNGDDDDDDDEDDDEDFHEEL